MEHQIQLKLKELRKRRKVTQKELAEEFQVSFQTISKWENGVTMPDIYYLPVIAAYFNVSIDVLLGIKSMDEEEFWRKFDAVPYWSDKRERINLWKTLYWNKDYFAFLVREVWNIDKPVDILDVGGGYGFLGMELLPLLPKGSSYTSIDLDKEEIRRGKEFFEDTAYEVNFIHCDFYDYEPEKQYDIVISLYLMIYLPEPRVILEKMKKSLKKGGQLICIDPTLEVEQAGYYSGLEEQKYRAGRPDFSPVWKSEREHGERDYQMGVKLPHLLKEAGLQKIQARLSDRVILYDAETRNSPSSEVFRNVYARLDSVEKGYPYFTARGMDVQKAKEYVEFYQQSKEYLDSEDAYAVKTSGLYFVWGYCEEESDDDKTKRK